MTYPRQRAAIAVITAMSALVLSYTWIWQRSFPGALLLAAILYCSIGSISHRIHGESARLLGLRLDNIVDAVRNAWIAIGIAVCVPLAAGAALHTWHFESLRRSISAAPWMILWGTAQQYGLLCVLYRRFLDLLRGPQLAASASATLFAIFHIPNPLLIAATLIAGIASCNLYRRVPNVFVLGVGHASVSFALFSALPLTLTHHMRIGPGYLLLQ